MYRGSLFNDHCCILVAQAFAILRFLKLGSMFFCRKEHFEGITLVENECL